MTQNMLIQASKSCRNDSMPLYSIGRNRREIYNACQIAHNGVLSDPEKLQHVKIILWPHTNGDIPSHILYIFVLFMEPIVLPLHFISIRQSLYRSKYLYIKRDIAHQKNNYQFTEHVLPLSVIQMCTDDTIEEYIYARIGELIDVKIYPSINKMKSCKSIHDLLQFDTNTIVKKVLEECMTYVKID
jgi:hypothetical protein